MMRKSRLLFLLTFGLILSVTGLLSGQTPALALTPAVTSATPNQGDQGQSLSVAIAGTDFTGATSVSFGSGVTVNSFTVDNSTQITASIAVSVFAVIGPRDVSVTSAAGTATQSRGFTVNQASPTISSDTPNQGLQGQTLNVTIGGSYFTGATVVSFGPGTTVNSYSVNDSGMIVANVTIGGSATPGPRNVSVTTAAGTATRTDGFTVLVVPTISSVSPSQAVPGQTLSVTMTGTNLLGATTVGFGSGITVTGFTVDSDSQITANITIGVNATVEPRDVSVTTRAAVGNLADGFAIVVPPDIARLTPASGRQGSKLEVIITGDNFTGATEVSLGAGVTVDNFTVDSATQITVRISIAAAATPGARDVSVSTPQTSGTMTGGFQVQAEADSISLYLWLLVVGAISVVGLAALAFVIRRRTRQRAI